MQRKNANSFMQTFTFVACVNTHNQINAVHPNEMSD